MSQSTIPQSDHDTGNASIPTPAPPLGEVPAARRRTPAEEARTLISGATQGALGTLSESGHPWASLATYGTLADGSPVFLLSTLAEHGRNLQADPRASVMVAEGRESEPLAHGRVTLLGSASRAEDREDEARAAHLEAVPSAEAYIDFHDFTLWVLEVERVRWVGGYGRMDSVDADSYRVATPDPTAPGAHHAISHLNEDHADALLAMAQGLGGFPDATSARCSSIDRYGIDLALDTERGWSQTRVPFTEACEAPGDLRGATVDLAKRSRAALQVPGS